VIALDARSSEESDSSLSNDEIAKVADRVSVAEKGATGRSAQGEEGAEERREAAAADLEAPGQGL